MEELRIAFVKGFSWLLWVVILCKRHWAHPHIMVRWTGDHPCQLGCFKHYDPWGILTKTCLTWLVEICPLTVLYDTSSRDNSKNKELFLPNSFAPRFVCTILGLGRVRRRRGSASERAAAKRGRSRLLVRGHGLHRGQATGIAEDRTTVWRFVRMGRGFVWLRVWVLVTGLFNFCWLIGFVWLGRQLVFFLVFCWVQRLWVLTTGLR